MPTYMDVHNLQEATALQVEQHHAADLAEQGKYGVKFLKYWFNESAGQGFLPRRCAQCRRRRS